MQDNIKKKKVVVMTSAHPRYDNRIFTKECMTISGAGYDVSLIVADGVGDDIKDNIRIYDVGSSDGRRSRMTLSVLRICRKAVSLDGDIYHIHDPELLPIIPLLKLRRKKTIYDVHEDLPQQIFLKDWIPSYLKKIVSFVADIFEKSSSRLLDGIVCVTPVIASRFPFWKIVLVQNFAIKDELISFDSTPYERRTNSVTFLGGLTRIRCAAEMIDAINLVPSHLNSMLEIVGEFKPSTLESELRTDKNWKRVRYYGWLSRVNVAKILGKSRAGMVLFYPLPNQMKAQPNKFFEYMSAGLPIIASNFPLWSEIIHDIQCGLVVDPLNPREIAKAIQWILEHPEEAKEMGERGRNAVLEYFNWDQEAEKLLKFYDQLLGPGTKFNQTQCLR